MSACCGVKHGLGPVSPPPEAKIRRVSDNGQQEADRSLATTSIQNASPLVAGPIGKTPLAPGMDVSGGASSSSSGAANTVTPEVTKREDYLSWDDYFMSVAFLSAMRSKDPSTQVGAAIVNAENRIVGIGYNGFPTGCDDDQLPWSRDAEDKLDTKYMYVVHAEMNAILNKNSGSIQGCRMYVALFPCNECAKLIIQSGIREVIYLSDKYHDRPEFTASRRMFELAGVVTRKHVPQERRITIDFGPLE